MGPEIEAKAKACERCAEDLEQLEMRLRDLHGEVFVGWRGQAGDSLREKLEARYKAVAGARQDLRDAAAKLRAAATSIAGKQ